MNILKVLWGETLALFVVFSMMRGLKFMVADGDGIPEAIGHGILAQAKWHVAPEHLVPLAWISDIYLIILTLATLISHFFG